MPHVVANPVAMVVHGSPLVVVSFRLEGNLPGARIHVRPFLSGRNFHDLHHENPTFNFAAAATKGAVTFEPYPGVPKISFLSGGEYRHQPDWYRRFEYSEEAARGLDSVEDLASPGAFMTALPRNYYGGFESFF